MDGKERNLQVLRDRHGIPPLDAMSNQNIPDGYTFTCHGSVALDRWRQVRALVPDSGIWPVILGNDEDARRVLEIAEYPPAQILKDASNLSFDQWRAELQAKRDGFMRAHYEKRYGSGAEQKLRESRTQSETSLHGEWPDVPRPMTSFTIPFERVGSGPPKEKVTIGLFPTPHGWAVRHA